MRRSLSRRRSQRLEHMLVAASATREPVATTTGIIETVPVPDEPPAYLLKPKSTSLPYLPALDGLRALAVIAVLIFHGHAQWLPGGFLGVDIFFVISGFIITRGLLSEWADNGRIDLRAFWWRRARRLLPAVYVLLIAVLVWAVVFEGGQVSKLRGDAIAALLYVTNWRFIIDGQNYFDLFARPSAFRHLWSLAVEEQFYLLWPGLLWGLLALVKRRNLVVLLIAGSAAVSTAWMVHLYTPGADVNRVYYGTDTRAAGLLIGALLAFYVARSKQMGRTFLPLRLALDLGAAFALALLMWALLGLDQNSRFLYEGGLTGIALCTVVLIAAAATPDTLTAKLLGKQPLTWVGARSYGIYLWHWPILLLSWPHQPTIGVMALELGAAVAIAAVSYHFVEQPLRRADIKGAWRSLTGGPVLRRSAVYAGGLSAAALVVALAVVVSVAKPEQLPPYFQQERIVIGPRGDVPVVQDFSSLFASAQPLQSPGEAAAAAQLPPAVQDPIEAAAAVDPVDYLAVMQELVPIPILPDRNNCEEMRGTAYRSMTEREWFLANCIEKTPVYVAANTSGSTKPLYVASNLQPVSNAYVTAIGDSVMLGAAPQLAAVFPNIDFDAAVGRQVSVAISMLRQKAAANTLGQYVVIGMGNNGTFTAGQFDDIMDAIGPTRRAIFVNLKEDRSWEGPNNNVIANGVTRYPNAVLVNWHDATIDHPELFWNDLIHLRPEGATYYAQLVAQYVR